MSCVRIFDVIKMVTIKIDGGSESGGEDLVLMPGFPHEELYKNETVTGMLLDLDVHKQEGRLDFSVTMHVALARNPTGSDDKTKGIDVGARWMNTATKFNYYCADNSEGSASWVDSLGLPVP